VFNALLRVFAIASLALGTSVYAENLAFTKAQVYIGIAKYKETCQICHGSTLANGQFGTPLRGSFFREKWKGKSLGELVTFMYEKMPPDNLMSLTPEQNVGLAAYILSRNDIAVSEMEMSTDKDVLKAVMLPW
jgi:mono/diheme cytochrome c family protein